MTEQGHAGVPVAEVETFLGLRRLEERGASDAYREPSLEGLTGAWVGAFAESSLGPTVVTPFTVTFDGTQGRSSDRHGLATLSVTSCEGIYVEFTKTYTKPGHSFRYRGELRGDALVGCWERPGGGGAGGLFAVRRAQRHAPEELARVTERARPKAFGGWRGFVRFGLVVALLPALVYLSVYDDVLYVALLAVLMALPFVPRSFLPHGRLVKRVQAALANHGATTRPQ